DPKFAGGFIGGALALLACLWALAALVRWLAARLPRPAALMPRLALANLHAPGALTRQLIVALGLGLALFATLSPIQSSLANPIAGAIPKQAPSFFVIDLPTEGLADFKALAAR